MTFESRLATLNHFRSKAEVIGGKKRVKVRFKLFEGTVPQSFGKSINVLLTTNNSKTSKADDNKAYDNKPAYPINQYAIIYEPRHEISNNEVCATTKAPDQPAHTRSLIRAFASRLHIL